MIALRPSKGRRLVRSLLSSALEAVLAFGSLAYTVFKEHPTFAPAWVLIGAPICILVPLRFMFLWALYAAPAISWDRDELQINLGGELTHIPWTDFKGHRLTWDLPRRLKVYRHSVKGSLRIDIAAFDVEQREALMTAIAQHSAAPPNQRVKLTPRVD
jgi:hypothetical protein